jgi:hypothetical protein
MDTTGTIECSFLLGVVNLTFYFFLAFDSFYIYS